MLDFLFLHWIKAQAACWKWEHSIPQKKPLCVTVDRKQTSAKPWTNELEFGSTPCLIQFSSNLWNLLLPEIYLCLRPLCSFRSKKHDIARLLVLPHWWRRNYEQHIFSKVNLWTFLQFCNDNSKSVEISIEPNIFKTLRKWNPLRHDRVKHLKKPKNLPPQNDWHPFGKEGIPALLKAMLSSFYSLRTKVAPPPPPLPPHQKKKKAFNWSMWKKSLTLLSNSLYLGEPLSK